VFRAGGVTFAVEPAEALTTEESEAIARLDPPDTDVRAPFLIRLVDAPPWTSDDKALFPRWEPAVLRWWNGVLRSSHNSFTAEIDPFGGQATLCRRETRAYPLETVIRSSMMARLPLEGGLPLHAAGVVLDARGVAFLGPSGAGKSTLAATSPHPVLSDELVSVAAARPFVLVRSGFWGEGSGIARPPAPLGALVALDKGPRTRLERLERTDAVRRIVGSITVPLVPELWTPALDVLGRLVEAVPVYRLEWAPSSPPWAEIERTLEAAGSA